MTHAYELFKDVLASIVGSAACVYTGQPFDTIKVRMQVQAGEFKSSLDCLRRTIGKESFLALWKGSLPAFVGSLGENAVGFGVNGQLTRLFKDTDISPTFKLVQPYFTGGITGFCSAFVLCPCDVIKCRAQLSRLSGGTGSMTEIIKATMKKDGFSGFYTGMSAQCMRDIPFYASFFGTYESFTRFFRTSFPNWPDTAVYFVSGGFAGQIAWAVSMPADSVKSIIQTSSERVTTTQVISKLMQTQGIRGFYNGMEVAIIRAFPANAALFVGYELSRKLLP
jgi:hypothetical protein